MKIHRTFLFSTMLLLLCAGVARGADPVPQVFAVRDGSTAEVRLYAVPPLVHWDLREFPNSRVPWVLGIGAVPDLDGVGGGNTPADRAIASATFKAAFDAWEAVTPAEIRFVGVGTAPATSGLALDGYNTLNFGDGALDDVQVVPANGAVAPGGIVVTPGPNGVLETQPEGDDLVSGTNIVDGGNGVSETAANNSGAIGESAGQTGLFLNNRSGVLLEADIVFNSHLPLDLKWVVNPATNALNLLQMNLQGVATHEIGHFIGIAHPEMADPTAADPADGVTPTMYLQCFPASQGNNFNQTLENSDKDACNFLYCPDLGDAPDPLMAGVSHYPSLVHDPKKGRTLNGVLLDGVKKGAEHIFGIKPRQPARNWTYEWLGRASTSNVDGEPEAKVDDRDLFDDGVKWFPNPPVWGRPLCVTAWVNCASDAAGNTHDYQDHPLYVNAWLDLNQNAWWDASEWFMKKKLSPPPPVGVKSYPVTSCVDLPPGTIWTMWLRCRLDFGEKVGLASNIDQTLAFATGAAQFGEVEDYPFWSAATEQAQWVWCRVAGLSAPPGVAMVFVGMPGSLEQAYSAVVDSSDCILHPISSSFDSTYYVGSSDETVTEYRVPTQLEAGEYEHTAKRKQSAYELPLTLARTYWMQSPPTPGPTPVNMQIPSVNVGLSPVGGASWIYALRVTVGTLDEGSGGWIEGPDTVTGAWDDTLRVSVWYRVAPGVLPLEALSPCNPSYSALPGVYVGDGWVTPQDGFEFEVPTGGTLDESLIVEVHSSWSRNGTINHQIIQFPTPTLTSADDTPGPPRLSLENHPNPFNPTTVIRYALPESAPASLKVYDVAGRLVRTIFGSVKVPAGAYEVEWDGKDDNGNSVSSGVYFCRLTAGKESLTRKVVLLK